MNEEMLKEERRLHIQRMAQRVEKDRLNQQLDQEQKDLIVNREALNGVADGMEIHTSIEEPAPEATCRETRSERKKREELQSAWGEVETRKKSIREQERKMLLQRVNMSVNDEMSQEELKAEADLLSEKLKATTLQEKARLLEKGDRITDQDKMEIQLLGEKERSKLLGDYARMLPIGSEIRKKAMKAKEEQEIRANKLEKKLKIAKIENPAERKREEDTFARHERYDFFKKIFRKDNRLSHEDAVFEHPVTKHQLVNVGRAFFGGTKPMYIFDDKNEPIGVKNGEIIYKQYLFKEAINCVGFEKPEGALVTEAAATLQDRLCGPYGIKAFAAEENGKILGSFQERITSIEEDQRFDLFRWQANPQDNIPEEMKKEILREHTLDWLLCNFDTKGENFLHRPDGHLSSFDKEASFNKIKDGEAARMSTTYKPHSNDTLYNVLFTEYANGRLQLDLSTVHEQIRNMEEMGDKEYLSIFDRMLTQKYGAAGEKNADRAEIEALILQRKRGLREEYRRFFTNLVTKRLEKLNAQEAEAERQRYFTGANGAFEFEDEKEAGKIPLLIKGIQNMDQVLVHDIPKEELVKDGATTYELTLPQQEADRMVQAANGYLTYHRNEDGSCLMRPSLPEKITFDGEEIELRKNYKRFTKALSSLVVKADGTLNVEGREAAMDFGNTLRSFFNGAGGKAETLIRKTFYQLFVSDKSLRGNQTPEEARDEMLRFLKTAKGYPGANEPKISVISTEAMATYYHFLSFTKAMETAEQSIDESREMNRISEEEAQKMKTEDVPAFWEEVKGSLKEYARCASQSMESEEVFLLGACSANADMLQRTQNPGINGAPIINVNDFRDTKFYHDLEDGAREIPQIIEERVSVLKGERFTFSEDPRVRAQQILDLQNYANYNYHQSASIGVIDHMMISLEAFAAESYQASTPAFTDRVGIGLYRSEEGFKDFYGKNREVILTPDQMRRYRLKNNVLRME